MTKISLHVDNSYEEIDIQLELILKVQTLVLKGTIWVVNKGLDNNRLIIRTLKSIQS